ncbi:hypothetical protein [Halanaerobium congolense]|jgi:hypothetical protein|nr:hypothetical protein [Halanaerobium congolense]
MLTDFSVSTEEELVRMKAWRVEAKKEFQLTNLSRELTEGRRVKLSK